jgi:hypothetical protein
MNEVTVVGYNFRNQRVATNTVLITSINPYGRPDADADGMPDQWELLNGLDPNFPDNGIDSDGDGLSNFPEYLAGTNPLEASSRLTLSMERIGQEMRLSFLARGGRSYHLQGRAGLSAPWTDVLEAPATVEDRLLEHAMSIESAAGPVFFRVLLEVASQP